MRSVLFIGLVWPEPTSSAAGTRMMQLVRLFQAAEYRVLFASAAKKSPYSFPLAANGVQEEFICLNSSSFDRFVRSVQPDVVFFDRFMIEEQYGWRVREYCPQALTVLDTEDLHFVRRARQEAQKKKTLPHYYTDLAKREIASILRCDLSLIIARGEMDLLTDVFGLPREILYYLPFLEDGITKEQIKEWKSFEDRRDFLFMGNFMHDPNWHTVQVLKKNIWPKLKERLPNAALHVYGAYAGDKVYQLHQPNDRFFIKGRAEDARATMSNYRVLLAPIAFGAGAKGKLIDAMHAGTPNVTSTVGAESMTVDDRWNGFIEDDADRFVECAVQLYQTKTMWEEAQKEGVHILNTNYNKQHFVPPFMAHMERLQGELQAHRQKNFIGQILQTQALNSTKYMSLWIEEKHRHSDERR